MNYQSQPQVTQHHLIYRWTLETNSDFTIWNKDQEYLILDSDYEVVISFELQESDVIITKTGWVDHIRIQTDSRLLTIIQYLEED